MADLLKNLLGKLGLLKSSPAEPEQKTQTEPDDLETRNSRIRLCYESAPAAEASFCHICGKRYDEEELTYDIEKNLYYCEECWNRKELEDGDKQTV